MIFWRHHRIVGWYSIIIQNNFLKKYFKQNFIIFRLKSILIIISFLRLFSFISTLHTFRYKHIWMYEMQIWVRNRTFHHFQRHVKKMHSQNVLIPLSCSCQVHKIVDLSSFPDREAMWYLEVLETYKLFYKPLIEDFI